MVRADLYYKGGNHSQFKKKQLNIFSHFSSQQHFEAYLPKPSKTFAYQSDVEMGKCLKPEV